MPPDLKASHDIQHVETPQMPSSQPQLPTTSTLVQISTLLRDDPVPAVLSARRDIPRVLLTAAHRGVQHDHSKASGTRALVDSLVSLAKSPIISNLRNEQGKRPVSAFGKTRAAQTGKTEMETITRAAAWATRLLTESVRGSATDPALNDQSIVKRIAHADTNQVFVAPRDRLDVVLATRYAQAATECFRHSFFRTNVPALAKVLAFMTSRATLSPANRELCLPVLNRVVLTYASAPCQLLASNQVCSLDLMQQGSESLDDQYQVLNCLSAESKSVLCTASKQFRRMLRSRVEEYFKSNTFLSYREERQVVNPLAHAAAMDIGLHWELMDEVRAMVSAGEAPFSLQLWGQRRFFRAVLSETLQQVEDRDGSGASGSVMVRRFPPFGRPFVRTLVSLADSLQSEDTLRQQAAVSVVQKLIWKTMDIKGCIVWTPNMHALMICSETLLELFSWAATYSLNLDEDVPGSCDSDALMCVCYLITLMEIPRLPGGEIIETERQMRSSASTLRDSLLRAYRGKQFDVSTCFKVHRVGGLAAFALCGIVGRDNCDIMSRSYNRLLPEDRENLRRAFEKGALWTTRMGARAKYDSCINSITGT